MNPVGRGFDSGRGEFYGADEFGGKGRSWEVNWLAVDARA
jgi:hypothetical protein